jgi:hypothetical protein
LQRKRSPFFPKYTVLFPKTIHLTCPIVIIISNGRKEATAFKYISDGSGRDSYILYNSGGLHVEYFPGNKHEFAASLR